MVGGWAVKIVDRYLGSIWDRHGVTIRQNHFLGGGFIFVSKNPPCGVSFFSGICLIFTPHPGEINDPIWRSHIFQNGLVKNHQLVILTHDEGVMTLKLSPSGWSWDFCSNLDFCWRKKHERLDICFCWGDYLPMVGRSWLRFMSLERQERKTRHFEWMQKVIVMSP